MNVSNCDICILIFIEGERIAAGKKMVVFSLFLARFFSLLLLSSKWAPIPTLFRMITDRYNKNGNIRTLCARQLATGMNTRTVVQLPSSPLHLQPLRHKGHVTCEIRSCRFFSLQTQVLRQNKRQTLHDWLVTEMCRMESGLRSRTRILFPFYSPNKN